MEAELKDSLGIEAVLIRGYGGVFEVELDGAPLFSKAALGRFPKPGEVTSLARAASGGRKT